MPQKTPKEAIDKALLLYRRGMSSSEVSRETNLSPSVITQAARAAGIIRTISEAKKLAHKKNPRPIEVINKNKVYGHTDNEKKLCASCGAEFPATLDFFYKRKRSNGRAYLSSYCKACIVKMRAEYCANNPEKIKESLSKSRKKNGHRHSKQKALRVLFDSDAANQKKNRHKEWAKNNYEHMVVYRKAYASENKEKIKSRNKEWRERNRIRAQASRANRKARVKLAQGSFSHEDIEKKLSEQKSLCFWCGESLSRFHIDHLTPISKGGSNYPENLVISCPTCNVSRGAKTQDEFNEYMIIISRNKSKIEERRAYFRNAMQKHRKLKRAFGE